MSNLVEIAESLGNKAWKPLTRKPKYTAKTQPRQRPRNVKEAIVKEREFENIRLQSEDVAEFDYAPGHCRRSYRIVVVRKNLTVERGEWALFDDVRYFFYISAPWQGAGLQRVRIPPGNWVAPAGSNRSGHGGDEMAEALRCRGSPRVTRRACRP